jgi:hypothetical protein
MKRIFGITLISLSVSILLLHSFVPHHHSPEKFNLQEILQKEPVKSPIDLLRVGFHLNLGTNHLENFQKNKSLVTEKNPVDQEEVNLTFTIPALISNLSFFSTYRETIFPKNSNSVSNQFINSFSYRGPPITA